MAPMKDETVLFNPGNNKFCVLNRTAAMIWGWLETPRSEADLVAALSERYRGAAKDRIEGDVQAALRELRDIECVVSV